MRSEFETKSEESEAEATKFDAEAEKFQAKAKRSRAENDTVAAYYEEVKAEEFMNKATKARYIVFPNYLPCGCKYLGDGLKVRSEWNDSVSCPLYN